MQSTSTSPLSLKEFLIRGLFGCLIGTWVAFFAVFMIAAHNRWLHLVSNGTTYMEANLLLSSILISVGGLIAGAIQAGFLRRVIRSDLLWFLWLLFNVLDWLLIGFSVYNWRWLGPFEMIVGGLGAIPQYLLLRRSLPFAIWWLVLSACVCDFTLLTAV